MNTITLTIDVTDWQNVPFDADQLRRETLEIIAQAAEMRAEIRSEELGVSIKTTIEIE